MNRMFSEQIQRDESLRRGGKKGNMVSAGGNIKLLLAEASTLRLGQEVRKRTDGPSALLIYFYVSVVSQRVENPVLFFPPSCQQQSATGPYRRARSALHHSLFLSVVPFHINAPVWFLFLSHLSFFLSETSKSVSPHFLFSLFLFLSIS